MKESYIAIYDNDAAFCNALTQLVKSQMPKQLPDYQLYDVVAFDSLSAISEFISRNTITLLITSEELTLSQPDYPAGVAEETTYMFKERLSLSSGNIEHILLFTDDASDSGHLHIDNPKVASIYKFAPPPSIVKYGFGLFSNVRIAEKKCSLTQIEDTKSTIIGIYSPVGRSGKTSFALCLAKSLSMQKSTLFITLDEYSTAKDFVPYFTYSDLSDLLYLHLKKSKAFTNALNDATATDDKLSLLPPMRWSHDLQDISPQTLISFIKEIVADRNYECVVIDFGQHIRHINDFIQACRVVFMPILPDAYCEYKISSFIEELGHMENSGPMISRIKRVLLPNIMVDPTNYTAKIFNGNLYVFTQKLANDIVTILREEKN